MKNKKLLKKKLNKNSFVILNNIQIISFINPELVENYIKFLEDKLTEPKEKELMIYIKHSSQSEEEYNIIYFLFFD